MAMRDKYKMRSNRVKNGCDFERVLLQFIKYLPQAMKLKHCSSGLQLSFCIWHYALQPQSHPQLPQQPKIHSGYDGRPFIPFPGPHTAADLKDCKGRIFRENTLLIDYSPTITVKPVYGTHLLYTDSR